MTYLINQLQSTAALMLLLFLGATLTGCNTIGGAGEDIQNAGQEIEDASGV